MMGTTIEELDGSSKKKTAVGIYSRYSGMGLQSGKSS